MRRLLPLLLLAACVRAKLTPEGERVRLTTNQEAVKGCKLVGPIESSDKMNGGLFGQGAAEETAARRIRNDAAKMGANVVLYVSTATSMSGSRMRGEAYACTEK